MTAPAAPTIRTFQVFPDVPVPLRPLMEMAQNLWWVWHPDAAELFRRLDRKLWDEVEATYRWWVDAGSPDATHSRFAVTPRWATGGIGIGWFTFGAKPRRDRHHLLPARNASSPASN